MRSRRRRSADLVSKTNAHVKGEFHYVALHLDTDMQTGPETLNEEITYERPDDHTTTVGGEPFRCPEALFKPSMVGKATSGSRGTTFQSIMTCDVGTRGGLYVNVVLYGGTAMPPSTGERMTKELIALAPSAIRSRWPPRRSASYWCH